VQLEQVVWWSSALSTALSASYTIASDASRNDSRLRHGMLRSAEQREGEEREVQHDVTRRQGDATGAGFVYVFGRVDDLDLLAPKSL
jgi:hypothetical protein